MIHCNQIRLLVVKQARIYIKSKTDWIVPEELNNNLLEITLFLKLLIRIFSAERVPSDIRYIASMCSCVFENIFPDPIVIGDMSNKCNNCYDDNLKAVCSNPKLVTPLNKKSEVTTSIYYQKECLAKRNINMSEVIDNVHNITHNDICDNINRAKCICCSEPIVDFHDQLVINDFKSSKLPCGFHVLSSQNVMYDMKSQQYMPKDTYIDPNVD